MDLLVQQPNHRGMIHARGRLGCPLISTDAFSSTWRRCAHLRGWTGHVRVLQELRGVSEGPQEVGSRRLRSTSSRGEVQRLPLQPRAAQ